MDPYVVPLGPVSPHPHPCSFAVQRPLVKDRTLLGSPDSPITNKNGLAASKPTAISRVAYVRRQGSLPFLDERPPADPEAHTHNSTECGFEVQSAYQPADELPAHSTPHDGRAEQPQKALPPYETDGVSIHTPPIRCSQAGWASNSDRAGSSAGLGNYGQFLRFELCDGLDAVAEAVEASCCWLPAEAVQAAAPSTASADGDPGVTVAACPTAEATLRNLPEVADARLAGAEVDRVAAVAAMAAQPGAAAAAAAWLRGTSAAEHVARHTGVPVTSAVPEDPPGAGVNAGVGLSNTAAATAEAEAAVQTRIVAAAAATDAAAACHLASEPVPPSPSPPRARMPLTPSSHLLDGLSVADPYGACSSAVPASGSLLLVQSLGDPLLALRGKPCCEIPHSLSSSAVDTVGAEHLTINNHTTIANVDGPAAIFGLAGRAGCADGGGDRDAEGGGGGGVRMPPGRGVYGSGGGVVRRPPGTCTTAGSSRRSMDSNSTRVRGGVERVQRAARPRYRGCLKGYRQGSGGGRRFLDASAAAAAFAAAAAGDSRAELPWETLGLPDASVSYQLAHVSPDAWGWPALPQPPAAAAGGVRAPYVMRGIVYDDDDTVNTASTGFSAMVPEGADSAVQSWWRAPRREARSPSPSRAAAPYHGARCLAAVLAQRTPDGQAATAQLLVNGNLQIGGGGGGGGGGGHMADHSGGAAYDNGGVIVPRAPPSSERPLASLEPPAGLLETALSPDEHDNASAVGAPVASAVAARSSAAPSVARQRSGSSGLAARLLGCFGRPRVELSQGR